MDATPPSSPQAPLQDTAPSLVTLLGWASVALSAIGVILLTVEFSLIEALAWKTAVVASGEGSVTLGSWLQRYSGQVEGLLGLSLLGSLGCLIISLQFLRRREWARRAYQGLLGLGVVWNVGALAGQQLLLPHFSQELARLDTWGDALLVASRILALTFVVVFAWLIRRLGEDDVRREFVQKPAQNTPAPNREAQS